MDWDAEAAGFDAAPDHGLHDPEVRAAWADLLAAELPPPPARGLDVGCGTGSLTLLAAELGHSMRGIDSSPAMIAVARTKWGVARPYARVELVVGDAADPSGGPATCDFVLCRHVLWALPDPAAALLRWARLLAPGGRLVLVEGRWWTGAGLSARRAGELLAACPELAAGSTTTLDDPGLWGAPVADERYLARAVRRG